MCGLPEVNHVVDPPAMWNRQRSRTPRRKLTKSSSAWRQEEMKLSSERLAPPTHEETMALNKYLKSKDLFLHDCRPTKIVNFMEIGTSTYNTLAQACYKMPDGHLSKCSTWYIKRYSAVGRRFLGSEEATGISVDVVPWVLERLPVHKNLIKLNCAVSGPREARNVKKTSACHFVKFLELSSRERERVRRAQKELQARVSRRSASSLQNINLLRGSKIARSITTSSKLYYVPKASVEKLERSYRKGVKCLDHGLKKCWACYHTGQLGQACASVNQRPGYFNSRLKRLGLQHYEKEKVVRSITYSNLLEFLDVLRPDILKLDCEGLDFDILRSVLEHLYKYGPDSRPLQIIFETCGGKQSINTTNLLIKEFKRVGYVLERDVFWPGEEHIDDAQGTARDCSLLLRGAAEW